MVRRVLAFGCIGLFLVLVAVWVARARTAEIPYAAFEHGYMRLYALIDAIGPRAGHFEIYTYPNGSFTITNHIMEAASTEASYSGAFDSNGDLASVLVKARGRPVIGSELNLERLMKEVTLKSSLEGVPAKVRCRRFIDIGPSRYNTGYKYHVLVRDFVDDEATHFSFYVKANGEAGIAQWGY